MNINLMKTFFLLVSAPFILTACSTAKIEARLEANPQCKDIINPKTGALMPCPGSDKAFYRELGLAPAKPASTVSNSVTPSPASAAPSNAMAPSPISPPSSTAVQAECKPQIHKKTGGTLPCPAPD